MKRKFGWAVLAVIALAACNSQPGTSLDESNIKYGLWADEKMQAVLPEQAKLALCDFNGDYQTVDSLSSSFSECASKIMTYRGKFGYILKDNETKCLSIGSSDDLVYYDSDGRPVLRFIQRYLPATGLTVQTLVLFADGKYKAAFVRSIPGDDAAALTGVELTTYDPIMGEHRVDNYEQ